MEIQREPPTCCRQAVRPATGSGATLFSSRRLPFFCCWSKSHWRSRTFRPLSDIQQIGGARPEPPMLLLPPISCRLQPADKTSTFAPAPNPRPPFGWPPAIPDPRHGASSRIERNVHLDRLESCNRHRHPLHKSSLTPPNGRDHAGPACHVAPEVLQTWPPSSFAASLPTILATPAKWFAHQEPHGQQLPPISPPICRASVPEPLPPNRLHRHRCPEHSNGQTAPTKQGPEEAVVVMLTPCPKMQEKDHSSHRQLTTKEHRPNQPVQLLPRHRGSLAGVETVVLGKKLKFKPR